MSAAAIAQWNKIMVDAQKSHARELARAAWEKIEPQGCDYTTGAVDCVLHAGHPGPHLCRQQWRRCPTMRTLCPRAGCDPGVRAGVGSSNLPSGLTKPDEHLPEQLLEHP